jgi:uncharacterized protein YfeS
VDLSLAYSTYGVYGGATLLSGVQLLLRGPLGEVDLGAGLRELRVEMHVPNPREAAERSEYAAYLRSMPKIAIRQRRGFVEALVCMTRLSAGEMSPTCAVEQALTPAGFRIVVEELLGIVASLRRRRASRELALDALGQVLRRALGDCPDDEEALRGLLGVARAVPRPLPADPWHGLDIDWEAFHPDARKILDDPFFWSPIEEFGPVGNDTGADVLAAYQRRAQVRDADRGIAMVRRLLHGWGPVDADVEDEALIALAFVQIMFHGRVSGGTARAALAALDRRSGAAEILVASEHVADLRDAMQRMRKVLQPLARG